MVWIYHSAWKLHKRRDSYPAIAPLFYSNLSSKIPWFRFRIPILIFLPELAHILQALALGFRYQLPYEESCNDTDGTIQTIGKPMTEIISFHQMHIKQRNEGWADNKVENPLEGNCDGNSSATNGIVLNYWRRDQKEHYRWYNQSMHLRM